MDITEFYNELENSLPKSTADGRKIWASKIIQEEIDLKGLSKLLWCEKKVASRFLWLLSEVGELNPNKLLTILPYLFELRDQVKHVNFIDSLATYWLISGVPPQNEASAITLLFYWIQSSETNVTTKSRSIFVLFNLTKKYPDLKNELKFCLEDQIGKNTNDFNKRATKILNTLE